MIEAYPGEEPLHFLTCPECGHRMRELSGHYKKYHPNAILPSPSKCQELCDNVSGENNPGYQHGGRLSCFSEKSGRSKEELESNKQKMKDSRDKKNNHFCREYYNLDEDFSKAQTRDLAWFIGKFGEEEGKKRHIIKIERWMTNFKKVNFSKISQDLFNNIIKNYVGDYYFATYDRPEMESYKNKEYVLRIGNTYCRPDFICLENKKVIEFDGDYWHSESVANPEKQRERDRLIQEEGFEVFHVKEFHYKQNKEKVISECIAFLTQ